MKNLLFNENKFFVSSYLINIILKNHFLSRYYCKLKYIFQYDLNLQHHKLVIVILIQLVKLFVLLLLRAVIRSAKLESETRIH